MYKVSLIFFVLLISITSINAVSVEDISDVPIHTIKLADDLLPEIQNVVQNCDRIKGMELREQIKTLLYGSVWKGYRHKQPYSKCHMLLSSLEQATYMTLPDYGLNYINSTGYLDHSYAVCRKAAYPHETMQAHDGNMHWSSKLGDEPKKRHCFDHPQFVKEKNQANKFAEEWVSLIDQQEYQSAFKSVEGIIYREIFNENITFEIWKEKLFKNREKISGSFKREHDSLSYGSRENFLNNTGKGIFKYNRFTIYNKLTSSNSDNKLTERIMLVEVDGVLRIESYSIK